MCVCMYTYMHIYVSIIYCFLLCLGPPGTGKTFVGIELMKVLLSPENSKKGKFGPILAVCFTNHALDQFLEVCNSKFLLFASKSMHIHSLLIFTLLIYILAFIR